jgi:hypothetical protein
MQRKDREERKYAWHYVKKNIVSWIDHLLEDIWRRGGYVTCLSLTIICADVYNYR